MEEAIPPPSRGLLTAMAVALGAGVAVAAGAATLANWDLQLVGVLLLCAVVSDIWAVDASGTPHDGIAISGSFIALVLAMALLGGAPAAAIGLATILVGHLRFRERPDRFLNNLVAYVWFPLIGGLVFDVLRRHIDAASPGFYAVLPPVFALALTVNFLLIAAYNCHLDGERLALKARRMVLPVLHWDIAAAVMVVAVAFLYHLLGIAAIGVFVLVLMTAQRLLGQVLASERRARELALRTTELDQRVNQLARMHVGVLSTMLRSLDLRDRMTARHSAAVARYAREIARALGLSEHEQELAHTAGLLHDIGKFVLPDRILKADTPLTDADWEIIRSHPTEGANLVAQLDGYHHVAQIILAHHERLDGQGYPRGLSGDDIPLLARVISVCDTYDVMTARDSYRKPLSSSDAIRELRNVSGTQLDPHIVEVFIDLLQHHRLRYSHGEDADFDRELAIEHRVAQYAAGPPTPVVEHRLAQYAAHSRPA